MARNAVNVTVSTSVNPKSPAEHQAVPVAAGGESGNVYVSYDTTKITGFNQLASVVAAAVFALANGNFKVNS